MTDVLRARTRMAVWCAAAAIGALVLASTALAVPTDPAGPAIATQATGVTVNWSSEPDPGSAITGYQGAFTTDPGATPVDSVSPGIQVPTPDEGQFYFRVRAVQDAGAAVSDYSTISIVIDRTGPAIGGLGFSGPLGLDGWYRSPLAITIGSCTDALVGISPAECGPRAWTEQGAFAAGTRSISPADLLGNSSQTPIPAFKYDATLPFAAALTQPGALVPEEPTFRWFPSTDAFSGVDHYVVQFRLAEDSDGPFTNIAEIPHTGGPGEYSANRQPALRAEPLPENTLLDWRVRTFDKAGNIRSSALRQVTIDPTVPPAPVITGGPTAPTQITSPTFTWEGTGQSFRWDVVVAGTANPIRPGNGPGTEATIPALPDGAYTFSVTQVTAAGRESTEAARSFVVDTTPPEPPTILTRPTFPAIVTPVFTWSTEPGAYSRWSVLGGGGAVIAGPTDAPVPSAEIPALQDGAYSFQVQQIDAAGNISSPTVEPFTVIAPLVPEPTTGSGGTITILPKQFARRLQPKAGKLITSRRPVLRWTRGPRGTKLFNLQIFRVTRVRGTSTPRLVKVLSVFPKGRAYRVPRTRTLPKTCYVWRVWPYTGREFTPKPLGVSNYCVASARVLKQKARVIAARKAALARSRR